jgi:hypothetical protein
MVFVRIALAAAVLSLSAACGGDKKEPETPKTIAADPCDGPKEDVKMAGRTGWEGTKAGAKTGVEGVKAFGGAAGGFVSGGSTEAEKRWAEGKEKTREKANEGASDTGAAAHSNPCR